MKHRVVLMHNMTNSPNEMIAYVDMDGVLVDFPYNIEDVHESIREECKEWCMHTNNHHSDFEGLFATLPPIVGGADALKRLQAGGYTVYLLSTAPWSNHSSSSDKRRWVETYLPNLPTKRLILSHRKDLNRGALLIDDRPNNGAKEFGEIEGQRWIHFGSEAFPDWHAVLAELDC